MTTRDELLNRYAELYRRWVQEDAVLDLAVAEELLLLERLIDASEDDYPDTPWDDGKD